MPKLKGVLKKKTLIFLAIYTIAMTGLVIGAYYLAIVSPKLTSSRALFKAKADIYNLYSLNVEDKLATNGLIALKPTSTNFYEEKSSLITRSKEAQEKLTESLEDTHIIPKGTKETKELLKEIDESLTNDLVENNEVLEAKRGILSDYKKVESIVNKAFGFSPSTEFERYEFPDNKEAALESVATTRNGLTKISKELKTLEDYQNPALYNSINSVIDILDAMENNLERNALSQVQGDVETLTDTYPVVITEAKNTLNLVLTSDKAINTLTRQTNLILEYEFLMGKVEAAQVGSN